MFKVGMKLKNIHNDRIVMVTEEIMTDVGVLLYRIENIDKRTDWTYINNNQFKHWDIMDVIEGEEE
tara:strand:+ start:288 stop:485 length:198 start_codon:yes stop_codon:yes gene_type:complete